MDLIYSIHARLADGGTGNTAYYAVLGPERAGQLRRVICSSYKKRDLPRSRVRSLGALGRAIKRVAALDGSGQFNDWSDQLFDKWASRVLEPSTILHCWSDLSHTLQRGKERGATTVLECMIHPKTLRDILNSEGQRWGVSPADLAAPKRFERSLSEIDIADFVTVPSQFNYDTHVKHDVAEQKLRVVPYGVDTQRFSPQLQSTARPFRVLFVGHISMRKGAPYMLEAWRELAWHNAELWLLGAVAPEMRSLLHRWQTLANVRWLGYQQNTADLYRQCDVFLFPSLAEGSALVTYEAMASGLPLVVSNNAGSLARDQIDGLVIEAGSVSAIATALEYLRANPDLRKEMGLNARRRIEAFTWHSYGVRLLEVYRELSRTRA